MRILRPSVLPLLALLVPGLACRDDADEPRVCLTPLAPDEPPCSEGFADSPWPGSHAGPYAQASSPLPGPVQAEGTVATHRYVRGTPIVLGYSPPYRDGRRRIWGSLVGDEGGVVLLDADTIDVVDTYVPAEREPDAPTYPIGLSGAYSLVDRAGRFVVVRSRSLEVFADGFPRRSHDPITLASRQALPDEAFCGASDHVAGMTATPDGAIAFVTSGGRLGVIPRTPDGSLDAARVAIASADAACEPDGETVSNSLAVDEDGGIYPVTSLALYRFDWDGTTLTRAFRVPYPTEGALDGVRLGAGSGSTPTLMGTSIDDDRFVVITDGRALMHLIVVRRDTLTPDAQPLREGLDPRIVCEVPVRFGDPDATESVSEQSVLVRGYASVVVNNQLRDDANVPVGIGVLSQGYAALYGGDPTHAPRGIERIDWDPVTKTCATVWANPEPSLPNGIPTMSSSTGLIYGIGLQDAAFGLLAIDFATGAQRFFVPGAANPCGAEVYDQMSALYSAVLRPTIEMLPQSCENSFYAATEIGEDGSIVTGTFFGVSRFAPEVVPPGLALGVQTRAGIDQGLDWLARAAARADGARADDDVARARRQLEAALERAGSDSAEADRAAAITRALRALSGALDDASRPDAVAHARAELEDAR